MDGNRDRKSSGCIICGERQGRITRGLCIRYHGRYIAAVKGMNAPERAEFEAHLIAAGKLLPDRKGQKLRPEDDEFASALKAFREKSKPEAEAKPEVEAEPEIKPQVPAAAASADRHQRPRIFKH